MTNKNDIEAYVRLLNESTGETLAEIGEIVVKFDEDKVFIYEFFIPIFSKELYKSFINYASTLALKQDFVALSKFIAKSTIVCPDIVFNCPSILEIVDKKDLEEAYQKYGNYIETRQR